MLRAPANRKLFALLAMLSIGGIAQGKGLAPEENVAPGIVFVLDGSGRLRLMADDLSTAVAEACLPLEVQEFNWSYGYCRVFCDLRNEGNHQAKGEELAGTILEYRACHPGARVYVVTHSAGAAVAIAAAEHLPDAAIDLIIMLAPAVSPDADIEAAVRASCKGVDVFCSHKDMISRCLALTGTADGRYVFAAGLNGFSPHEDASLPGLRCHFYDSEMGHTGHHGGHYGWTKIDFLREYIVPLLAD
jgi:hypothetical protein